MDTFKLSERKKLVMEIKESKGISDVKARVVVVMDFSGSMRDMYESGVVQEAFERLIPIALGFDDDGALDAYLFHESFIRLDEAITRKNVDGYVATKIIGKYRMGSTNYAPVTKDIIKRFGNPVKTSGGFLGLGGSSTPEPAPQPTYVLFFTDGNCDDRSEMTQTITEAANHGIFFQFIGLGNLSFDYLQKLDDLKGRRVDNADFKKISNLKTITDEALYRDLMDEFPSWLTEAKKAKLLL